MLANQFKNAYLSSLSNHFRSFYDDMHTYGDVNAKHCIYFIHGTDGAPGQIRFALPAANRFFGLDVYVKGLFNPEFSCRAPIWEKYTRANLDKKITTIVQDLTALSRRYGKVLVFCSSNGFYDIYAAYGGLDSATKAALTLFWVACAPDHFDDTAWEAVFYRINGLRYNHHRWVALPNSNYLRWFNPEAPYRHRSKAQQPPKYFYKHDMESRFYALGTLWSYFSISCFNDCLKHLISQSQEKITIPTYVLAAEQDGYWQGKNMAAMTDIMQKYISQPIILKRPTSHLWVAAPEHVYVMLQRALGDSVQSERR